MSGARSRRLPGSLGESWGDVEYDSDSSVSIHTESDFENEGSDMDGEELKHSNGSRRKHVQNHEILDTPRPLSRVTRASSKTPETPPTNMYTTPSKRAVSRQSPGQSSRSNARSGSRSQQSTPGSEFIMPSMYGTPSSMYERSPLGNSQPRLRKSRVMSNQHQFNSAQPSPRYSNRQASSAIPVAQDHYDEKPRPGHYLQLLTHDVIMPTVRYFLGVCGHAMETLKPIFGMILAIGLIVFLLASASRYAHATVQKVLTPVCSIPGSSYVLGFCESYNANRQEEEADFEGLMSVQSKLEDVVSLSEESGSSHLPRAMEQSRSAIRDLKHLVQYSRLPSRSELELEFQYFIETAREASDQLIAYNGKIGSTLDRVISTNKWSTQVLHGLEEKEAATGALSKAVAAVNPFSLLAYNPTLNELIYDQYLKHVSQDKEDIGQLIDMAHALQAILNNLEDRLDNIATIAQRDGFHINKESDELLSQLWTFFGGNKSKIKDLKKQLQLLKQVHLYNKQAETHVNTTLRKLKEIRNGLEDLKSDMNKPEILGPRDNVPLAYHLEIIGKSVERLQDVRGDQRQRERDAFRKTMGGLQDKTLPGGEGEMPLVYAKE